MAIHTPMHGNRKAAKKPMSQAAKKRIAKIAETNPKLRKSLGRMHTDITGQIDGPALIEMSPAAIGRLIKDLNLKEHSEPLIRHHSHYFKPVAHLQTVDVYRVLRLFDVTDPSIAHAVKKLLVAGGRGAGKDINRDIQEAIDSLNRYLEMQSEDGLKKS